MGALFFFFFFFLKRAVIGQTPAVHSHLLKSVIIKPREGLLGSHFSTDDALISDTVGLSELYCDPKMEKSEN